MYMVCFGWRSVLQTIQLQIRSTKLAAEAIREDKMAQRPCVASERLIIAKIFDGVYGGLPSSMAGTGNRDPRSSWLYW